MLPNESIPPEFTSLIMQAMLSMAAPSIMGSDRCLEPRDERVHAALLPRSRGSSGPDESRIPRPEKIITCSLVSPRPPYVFSIVQTQMKHECG
ncbi:hypothetical protein EYF80_048154 [Liparis tanakae]|uniref:Uncharacterized protein n=1 Tax=Liparis tanakae TaxID=230148 RepID=A0A4Z2FMZ2_9TELE|nr:hypothetical protein EYF80_048154 [Liparis tanakae]